MIPTPIKRSKNLVVLSKDHHEGLLIVWKIRQGIRFKIAAKRMADFVAYAFDTHLQSHFIEEEKLLFSKLPCDDSLLIKAEDQHATLRQIVAQLRSYAEPTGGQLEAFGNLLEEHIRFEERELFGHLEAVLSGESMADIGTHLEVQQNKEPVNWRDEFWVRR